MTDDTPANTTPGNITAPPPAPQPPPTATMNPAAEPDPRHELVAAAERAAHAGDRSALLTYMRLKRSLT